MADFQKILEGFLSSDEAAEKIRLGRGGVVGRVTYALVGLLVILGIAASRVDATDVLSIVYFAGGTFLVYLIGVLAFAFINPGAALLEGAELLRWRKIELSTKDNPHPPQAAATIPDPESEQLPPPNSES